MQRFPGAILFISHDRAFLDRIATRIVELDRGKLISFPGDYLKYIERKDQLLAEEKEHNSLFDKKPRKRKCGSARASRRAATQPEPRALLEMRDVRAGRIAPLRRRASPSSRPSSRAAR